MNGPDRAEQRRSLYWKVLKALDEAHFWLERMPAGGPGKHAAERSGAFHLGRAGGVAFCGLLPGIEMDALFDDISDAAEERDLGHVGRIRLSVAARLRSDKPANECPVGEGSLDWAAGFLQMLAALAEARRAWSERDRFRHSLMLGFLAGHLRAGWSRRYKLGPLSDAVIAVHDRDPRRAATWVEAESIAASEGRGESRATDVRALLLRWVGDRLAAGHRFSEPLWVHVEGETDDERQKREARERAYLEREETSIQLAQNFGKRIHAEETERISVPGSYAVNRALVLGSHEEDDQVDGERDA